MTPDVLRECLDGGQAFRWYPVADGWMGTFGQTLAALRLRPNRAHGGAESPGYLGNSPTPLPGDLGSPGTPLPGKAVGILEWSVPVGELAEAGGASDAAAAIAHYLRASETDPADALPWRSDPHLARCIAEFPGLRILRQPFGETLLCFLCSATKQIVQIKQMVALLAQRHGAPLASAEVLDLAALLQDSVEPSSSRWGSPLHRGEPAPTASIPAPAALTSLRYRLPTWDELADVPERLLRECLLGFRARYIAETAQWLRRHPGWLEETERLPYAEAKERLCSLPGVGEKVADCVLLFGAGQDEAFPVDVWILKTLARRYQLEGWKPAQLAQFGRAHFGPHAGLAQQFLFSWERAQARSKQ